MFTGTHRYHMQTGSPLQACSLTGVFKSQFFVVVSNSRHEREIILICVVLVQMQREKTKEEEDSEANMTGSTGRLGAGPQSQQL